MDTNAVEGKALTPLAATIEQAVLKWRKDKYPGVGSVTKRLLEYWFKEWQHGAKGAYAFWECQKLAMETLIYLYEVRKYRRLYDLIQNFSIPMLFDPSADTWPKYCFKMATGSGKTTVMAMAMVWHYFNAGEERDDDLRFTRNFLLLAPNIIVLDRLWEAFGDGSIFKKYPMVPPEWADEFDFQCTKQSQDLSPNSKGRIYLTNIQQLYEREKPEPINPAVALMGPSPMADEVAAVEALRKRLCSLKDLLVINDEAHHVWTDELEWNKVIAELSKETGGLASQLDFTATPKDPSGHFFPHIVYNFTLKEAIEGRYVKRVRIGEITDAPIPEQGSFITRNQVQLEAGIQIHQQHLPTETKTAAKSVLFIICDLSEHADEVGRYLNEEKGYKDKVLVIHTDRKGNIKKNDLTALRKAARDIDNPDSPYTAIVSVMMLKEGWDVKSVNVIVPLRAFTSPILPEQTLGRGLRRVFPKDITQEDEVLIVIDHPKFRSLWESEIKQGELIAEFTKVRDAYEPLNLVQVDPDKLEYDLEFPMLEGGIQREVPDFEKLEVASLPEGGFVYKNVRVPEIKLREKDLLTQKVIREISLAFDYTENLGIYIGYVSNAILRKVGCPADRSLLVPKIRDYITTRLFTTQVVPDELETRQKLNRPEIRTKLLEVFAGAVNELSKGYSEPSLLNRYLLSSTKALHTYNNVVTVKKCVFDCLPYPKNSTFELRFIQWLDNTADVIAFSKIMPQLPLQIPYHDDEGYMRSYTPDFIVKTEEGMFLIETKGLEDLDVKHKDAAAKLWCGKAEELTGVQWRYLKVKLDYFYRHRSQSFAVFAKSCEI